MGKSSNMTIMYRVVPGHMIEPEVVRQHQDDVWLQGAESKAVREEGDDEEQIQHCIVSLVGAFISKTE